MPSLNVLVVEDNPSDVILIERMLATDGQEPADTEFVCIQASSSSLIPDLIAQTKIDAVLLDLCGPGPQGLDTLRRFCEHSLAPPVVVLTGPADTQLALLAMQAGAQDFLVKDQIEANLLAGIIRYSIERKRIEQELKRSVQELALLDQVRTTLAREVELPVILRMVVEAVADTFDYQLVSLYTLHGETLILQHQVGYAQVLPQIAFGQGVISRAMRCGQPVLLEDVHSDPTFLGAIEGIVSEIAVPLLLNGQVVGALNVESTKGVRLGDADLKLLIALSKDINIAFERAYLYEELSRSSERFRTSVETLLDGFAILTAVRDAHGKVTDFRYEYINQAGGQLNEWPCEDHIGRTVLELFPGHLDAGLVGEYSKVVETGVPLVREILDYRPEGAGGLAHIYDVRAVRLGDGVAVTWRDITERRQNERLLEQRNQELALLNHAGQIFNSSLDLDQVMQDLLGLLCPQIAAASSFWLIDPANGAVVCRQAWGPQSESVHGWQIPLGEGLVGWVAQHGERDVIADAQEDPRHYRLIDQKTGLVARSILTVPLKSKEKTIGVLQLLDTNVDHFSQPSIQTVEALGAVAAVAVENARLYEEVERLAIQDELTGLYNRRGFNLLANQQLKQAVRGDNPLLLIFTDVDALKKINDSFGHESGDRALMAVAQLLRDSFRVSDILARLGGDEFAVLALVARTDDPQAIVRRLREKLRMYNDAPGQSFTLSMSIGHAIWRPEDPCPLDNLLAEADASMYTEKATKR